MVLTLLRALPGVRDVLVTVACRLVIDRLGTSRGVPGPHDFAVRQSRRPSGERIRVHRIPPHVRDDRETPLMRGGTGESIKLFLPNGKAKNFCLKGWTGFSKNCPSGKSVAQLAAVFSRMNAPDGPLAGSPLRRANQHLSLRSAPMISKKQPNKLIVIILSFPTLSWHLRLNGSMRHG